MNILHTHKYIAYSSIVILFTLASLLAYHVALSFGFWKDDWIAYWGAKTVSPLFYMYWFHPGSTIQFFLFSHLFPPNSLPWQISGLVLRIIASICVFLMTRSITQSKRVSLFAGLLYAVSPLALDAVGWPTIQVVTMDVIAACITIIVWKRMLTSSSDRSIRVPVIFTAITILCDPFRTFPILFFISFMIWMYRRSAVSSLGRKLIRFWIVLPFLLFLFVRFGLPRVEETTVYHFIRRNGINPAPYAKKVYVIGNYFNSMSNIIVGSVLPDEETLSTGTYNRITARFGLLCMVLFFSFGVLLWRRKDRDRFPFLFFLLWILLFYVPSFVSEPRLTMGATHRYMALAGVGWVGLLSLLLSRIRPRFLFFPFAVFILMGAMQTSRHYLIEWHTFRSRSLAESIWRTVDRDVPHQKQNVLLSFRGDHSVIANTINYSSISPFTVYRDIRDVTIFPLYVGSDTEAVTLLCDEHPVYILGKGITNAPPMPIESYFSWEIKRDGTIKNITDSERLRLTSVARTRNCTIVRSYL